MIGWLSGRSVRDNRVRDRILAPRARFALRPQNSRYACPEEPGLTLSTLYELPAKPVLVRLIFFNDQDKLWTLDSAAVALTSSIGDGSTPLGSDGGADARQWRRVTFAHGGQNCDNWDGLEASERFGLSLEANPRESGRPQIAYSDWIALDGPDRVDGDGALLLVRAYSCGHIRFSGCVGPPHPSVGIGRHGHVIAGNAAAPPFEGDPRADDRIFACYGVECVAASGVATVIGIGDSIIHGSCSSGELSGLGTRACVHASKAGRPVAYFNEAYPGRNSVGFHWNGAHAIDVLRPQIALIQTWSQNEEWSKDSADAAFARSMALADFAVRRGCVPILATAAPVFARQPEFDSHRVRSVARVRAAGRDGMRVLDLDAIWGNGGSPNAYRLEYDCGDGMHTNDHGCEAAGRAFAQMIVDILSRGK